MRHTTISSTKTTPTGRRGCMSRLRAYARRLQRPYLGAGMLFWSRDEEGQTWVVLGRRAYRHGLGYREWSLPGGGYEDYDGSTLDTAVRESREEIHWKVGDLSRVRPLYSIRCLMFRFDIYEYELKERVPLRRPCSEFSQVRWFRADQLPIDTLFLARIEVGYLLKRLKREIL